MTECFLCELVLVDITFRSVVLSYVMKRSAYVHDVRNFWIAYSADVERMVVSTAPDGANSINSGRVVELIQYIDCRSIEKVVVESL